MRFAVTQKKKELARDKLWTMFQPAKFGSAEPKSRTFATSQGECNEAFLCGHKNGTHFGRNQKLMQTALVLIFLERKWGTHKRKRGKNEVLGPVV